MKILKMIREGQYTKSQEAGEWNRMGSYMMKGAYVYDFGNDIALHTYNDEYWWLYINGDLVSYKDCPETLSNDTINEAFADAKKAKLKSIVG